MTRNRPNRAKYQYFDMTMVSGIVTNEPEAKVSSNGNNYAGFCVGIKIVGRDKSVKFKNFKCAAYGEIGNEILALAHKNDNIVVYGHISPFAYQKQDGKLDATLWLNVTKWKKNPTREDLKAPESVLNQIGTYGGDADEEDEVDIVNEEFLF